MHESCMVTVWVEVGDLYFPGTHMHHLGMEKCLRMG